MAKFGFDWGGSLECNESLRQIARLLYAMGHEVHIIPACGVTPTTETYTMWLRSMDVPFTGIHRVYVDDTTPRDVATGLKVTKMKELGCHILYDDNLHNLEAVRNAGMEAVQVRGNEPVPFPPELRTISIDAALS